MERSGFEDSVQDAQFIEKGLQLLEEIDSLGVFDILLELLKDDRTVSALIDTVVTYATPERLSKLKAILVLLDRIGEGDGDIAAELLELLRDLRQDPLWDRLKSAKFRSELTEALDILQAILPLKPVIVEISSLLSEKATIERLSKLVPQAAALKPESTEPVKGLRGLLKTLGDPEVQKGLGYIFALVRIIGKDGRPS